jgi:ubiquinone/menaquinone biosynthesis C-methylase UbiE
MRYTFGHTSTAAERLKSIADFFNPLAKDFIQANVSEKITSAVDLGCGPGYTTSMLADATEAIEISGIDISEYFIELALNQYPQYNFQIGDVTNLSLPLKYDLFYCRFLLSHLKNLSELLERWTQILNPGGCIILDELEDIKTTSPVFKKYLQINEGLINSQGAELYVGRNLDKYISKFTVLNSESEFIKVDDSLAATWFYPNTISIWKSEKFVRDTIQESERMRIAAELFNIHNQKNGISNITWEMKRIVITT